MHLVFGLLLVITAACAFAQQYTPISPTPDFSDTAQPASPEPQRPTATTPAPSIGSAFPDAPSHTARQTSARDSVPQPVAVLAVAPNSHTTNPAAASLATTFRQSSNLTTLNSSSLIFTGGASSATEQSEQGASGAGKNCFHASSNNGEGRDWITSLVALTSHKGGSYCALGEGGFWKRGTYAATRAFVAHRYNSANGFNVSQFPGAYASGLPGSYYPYDSGDRLAARYASAIGRDAVRNMFSEFWPDFATHVLRRRP
jgi:hypothetical protein